MPPIPVPTLPPLAGELQPARALAALAEALRASRGFAHKTDIAAVRAALDPAAADAPAGPPAWARALDPAWAATGPLAAGLAAAVPNGDDTAAVPLPVSPGGGGHLLFAIEGLVEDFVARDPWFAGYSALMVNLSDIAAMGGRAIGVVDAIWAPDAEAAVPVLAGLAAAAARYGVPVLGGHSNLRAAHGQLAVAVLGHARALLSSFEARPGDRLMVVVDLRGAWRGEAPYWNASTQAPPERLRADLALLPALAEAGLCRAAKDISMAGVLGSTLMLLEASGVGATVDLDALPAPPGLAPAERLRWLQAFPSYGFVLSVAPDRVEAVQQHFAAARLACAAVGTVEAGRALRLAAGSVPELAPILLWDAAMQSFILPPGPAADREPAHG